MARYRDADDDRRDDDFDDRPRRRDRDGDYDEIGEAKSKVKGPGICLLIVGIISVLLLGWSVISYFTTMPAQFEAERVKIENNPQMQPAQKEQFKEFMTKYEEIVYKVMPVQWALISISSVLIIVGSIKMMSLSSTGWSRTAAILAMIPMVSGCCILGIPFGIWALVVLGKPEVKRAFAAKSGKLAPDDDRREDDYR